MPDVRISCDQVTLSGAHLDRKEVVVAGPIAPEASDSRGLRQRFLRPSEGHVACHVSGVGA
ncbi:MAG: hypothetical protein ACTHK2_13470 [Dokdonella sp.]|uniref:hypothetical protein n=1 Tax=Dokdonella sp. TaxID=2291710 RepID=UPI003F7FAE7F